VNTVMLVIATDCIGVDGLTLTGARQSRSDRFAFSSVSGRVVKHALFQRTERVHVI
jgi:hypothetical protein